MMAVNFCHHYKYHKNLIKMDYIKKLFAVLIFISSFNVYSQNEWKLEINTGVNIGDYLSNTGISIGADISYLIPINEKFSIGPTTGFSILLLNNSDNIGFLPIAASGEFLVSNNLFIGADVGYSAVLIDGFYGGFYFRPKIGYTFNKFNLVGSYSGITQDGGLFSFIKLGVEFKL